MQFSIITVCYNSAKTIKRTIESVLSQTESDYEYIIVDGNSKDTTVELIKEYEPQFNGKLRWISEQDTGIYNAMNKGISMCKGEFIFIVNSDDWLEPNSLELFKEYLVPIQNPTESVYCGWMYFHYNDGSIQLLKSSRHSFYKSVKKYSARGINHPAFIVPKQIYNKYGTFDEKFRIYADTDLILRYFKAGINFYFPKIIITNMSDGGVSNKQVAVIGLEDRQRLLKRYSKTDLEYYYLLCNWYIKKVFKRILPIVLVKWHRKI